MIGKLVGALVGKQASRHISGVNETGGALLGAAAVPLVRRLGVAGLIAAAVGGYALKRHLDKNDRVKATSRQGVPV
jgi:hypothetical protein